MKIRLLKTMAGPDRTACKGDTIHVPEDEAVRLVEAGAAEYYGPVDDVPAEPVAAPDAVETATAPPAAETADAPPVEPPAKPKRAKKAKAKKARKKSVKK